MNGIIDTIVSLFEQEPQIIAAYLFGSTAKGIAAHDSDIDIAVLLKGEGVAFPHLELVSILEKTLGQRVDLIVLNRATELLKHEIRKTGRLIFERDSNARKQFEIRSRKYFEDFLYLHNRYVTKILYKNIVTSQ